MIEPFYMEWVAQKGRPPIAGESQELAIASKWFTLGASYAKKAVEHAEHQRDAYMAACRDLRSELARMRYEHQHEIDSLSGGDR